MALVLRKAVAKHLTIMTCMKGRTFSTIAKRNPIPFSSSSQLRKFKKRIPSKSNIHRASKLLSRTEPRNDGDFFPPIEGPINCSVIPEKHSLTHLYESKRNYSKSCPHPCGPFGNKDGCDCLPPPCNVPPRSVQYMTGYYYYPYGTWFSGPFHVTGTCVPVNEGGPCPVPRPIPCPKPCTNPCPKCCAATCICPSTETAESGTEQTVKCSSVPKTEVPVDVPKLFQFNKGANIKKKSKNAPGLPLSCNYSTAANTKGHYVYLSRLKSDSKRDSKAVHKRSTVFDPKLKKSNVKEETLAIDDVPKPKLMDAIKPLDE